MSAANHVTREIDRRYGDEVRQRFGIEPAALTANEARYLIGFKTADQLRTRAVKAAQGRGIQDTQGALPERPSGITQPEPNNAGKNYSGVDEPKSSEQAESGGAGDRTNQAQESERGDFSLEQPTAASLEAHEQKIADEISITMTLKPEHLEMLKDSPFMLLR